MNDVFLKLLSMSVTASWVIAAVILLRLFLRKAPKWPRCILWAMVGVRLLCPFSFESAFSLIPDAGVIGSTAAQYIARPAGGAGIAADTGTAAGTGIVAGTDTVGMMTGGSPVSASESGELSSQAWVFAGSIVWICGLAILLGYAMFSFLRIHRKMEEGIRLGDNVYLCDIVRSPFVLGLIRPRIYLPSDMEDVYLEYVLAHERAHLKRRDHWWKALGYVLLAVYWFNPLVWAAYILLCRDIELACDEKAVRDLNMAGRKAYSRALTACSMKRQMVMVCPLAFGEVGVKERVKTVLNYRKPALWLIAAALVVCAVAAVCFLTDPKTTDSLAEMIDAKKDELTERIGTMISEAEAVRYKITDWQFLTDHVDEERADCYFAANWISVRDPEDDPMIQGMYQTAESLFDEGQRTLALEAADGWLAEMRSWPEEEYLEQPIVVMREGRSLALYYPYVMDGIETLIPLQEYVDEEWTEDTEKRYWEGVSIIEEVLRMGMPEETIREGINYYDVEGVSRDAMVLDEVEWVADSERAAELGLDPDLPGGFYVYNEKAAAAACPFAEDCTFTLLDWWHNFEPMELDKQTFLNIIEERRSTYSTVSPIPFIIEIKGGKIVGVTEQYVP